MNADIYSSCRNHDFRGYNKGNFRINKVSCVSFDSRSLYYFHPETQKHFWQKSYTNFCKEINKKNDKCYCTIHEKHRFTSFNRDTVL